MGWNIYILKSKIYMNLRNILLKFYKSRSGSPNRTVFQLTAGHLRIN